MKLIPLTRGQSAMVDDADFDWLNQQKWCAWKDGFTWYAARHGRVNQGEPRIVRMHRQLLDAGAKEKVDHVDGNGLNNQRSNLRLATKRQNAQGRRRKSLGKSSKYRGVSWVKRDSVWAVSIGAGAIRTNGTRNRKTIMVGYFRNEIEAAKAYDAAARKHFGKFASPNFTEEKSQ
jgi:hypothetical protein